MSKTADDLIRENLLGTDRVAVKRMTEALLLGQFLLREIDEAAQSDDLSPERLSELNAARRSLEMNSEESLIPSLKAILTLLNLIGADLSVTLASGEAFVTSFSGDEPNNL